MKVKSTLFFTITFLILSNLFVLFAQEVELTEAYMLGSWEVNVEEYEKELRSFSAKNDIPLEEEKLENILKDAASQVYECQSEATLIISTNEEYIEGNWRVDIQQKKLFLRFNLDAAELPLSIIKVEENKLHFQDNEVGLKTVWNRVLD